MPYIPPEYPTEIPTYTDLPDRIDFVDVIYAARYNEIKKELRAALTELGILPKGTFADVTTRLNDAAYVSATNFFAPEQHFKDHVHIEKVTDAVSDSFLKDLLFDGKNSNQSEMRPYARIKVRTEDITPGSEIGYLEIQTISNGIETPGLRMWYEPSDPEYAVEFGTHGLHTLIAGSSDGEDQAGTGVEFLGQMGGWSTSGGGYRSGDTYFGCDTGSDASNGDTDGGDGGDTYIFGGHGGAPSGAGNPGTPGTVWIGRWNTDYFDTRFSVGHFGIDKDGDVACGRGTDGSGAQPNPLYACYLHEEGDLAQNFCGLKSFVRSSGTQLYSALSFEAQNKLGATAPVRGISGIAVNATDQVAAATGSVIGGNFIARQYSSVDNDTTELIALIGKADLRYGGDVTDAICLRGEWYTGAGGEAYDGNVTRAKTIYAEDPPLTEDANTTKWAIQSDGDVQINSDKALILEGSATVKGDSGFVFVSADNKISVYINGTEEAWINSTGLHSADGWSGTFINGDGNTVTVQDGIITGVA